VFPTDWTTAEGELYSGYREKGYFPGAFINMLAFLGWNPGTPQEIFTLDELSDVFTLDRVSKAGAKFDPDKTKWFQQQYLRGTSNEELAKMLFEELGGKYDLTKLNTVCHLMKERATFIKDIATDGLYLLERPESYDEQTVSKKWKNDTAALMTEFKNVLGSLPSFDHESIEHAFKSFLEEKGMGIGAVLPLFRLLLTGTGMGPSMFEIASFLGKEECLNRMDQGLTKIEMLKTQA
jgi:glutamyl-tRNA synthetase